MPQSELETQSRVARLSEREREVMAYVAAHYQSKAIARLLGTAPKTVDAQIANACKKLGAENRNEAVRKLIGAGVRLDIGDHPLWVSDPIAEQAVDRPYRDLDNGDADADFFLTDLRPTDYGSGRLPSGDDLSGSGTGPGPGHGRRTASPDDPLSGVGASGAVEVPDRPAGHVLDPEIRELSGGRRTAGDPGRLGLDPGLVRLAIAGAIAFGLAIGAPAALYGAVMLQRLILSLQ